MDGAGHLRAVQKDYRQMEPSIAIHTPPGLRNKPGWSTFLIAFVTKWYSFLIAILGQVAWFFNSAGGLVFFEHWPSFFLTFAGILAVLSADVYQCFLQSLITQLFRGVLKHIQLHHAGIRTDIIARKTYTANNIVGIYYPSIQCSNGRNDFCGQISWTCELSGSSSTRHTLCIGIPDV